MKEHAGTDASANTQEVNHASVEERQRLHDTFGLDEHAGSDALAEAYFRLRERYHPQQNPSDPLAPEIVRYLDVAYARLVAPQERQASSGMGPTGAVAAPVHKPQMRTWWAVPVAALAIAAVAFLSFLFFSPPSTVRGEPTGDAAAGKTLWATIGGSPYCGSCHGASGEGGFGPDLAGRRLTFDQFRQQLRRPYGIMPAYTERQVSDQQVADLVAYFTSLAPVAQPGPWRVTVPAGAPPGQRLFIETVGCGQCHGATADRQRQGEARLGTASLAQYADLVYNHTATSPDGRMGNFSRTRLPEDTLGVIWRWISEDLGLRVPIAATWSTSAAASRSATYELTLENQAQVYSAGNLYIALSVPAGATVTNTSTYGFQRVERYSTGGYDIAVWLTPQLAAGEKRTYAMTVSGSGAGGGAGAFVRWLSPTRAGDQLITALAVPR